MIDRERDRAVGRQLVAAAASASAAARHQKAAHGALMTAMLQEEVMRRMALAAMEALSSGDEELRARLIERLREYLAVSETGSEGIVRAHQELERAHLPLAQAVMSLDALAGRLEHDRYEGGVAPVTALLTEARI